MAIKARFKIGLAALAVVSGTLALAQDRTPGVAAPRAVTVAGDASPNGFFDPAVLRLSDGKTLLAYTGIHYYQDDAGNRIQDTSVRLAVSDGAGGFKRLVDLGSAAAGDIADPTGRLCAGTARCAGRWLYEVPWVIDDRADGDRTRRYKVFAHKYFFYPPSRLGNSAEEKVGATKYHLGSVVMWTAPAPAGPWSAEIDVFQWRTSPVRNGPTQLVNDMHPDLAGCTFLSEGGATVRRGKVELVAACFYDDPTLPGSLRAKVVSFQSGDHARSFEYTGTLLDTATAHRFGGDYFTTPTLLPSAGEKPLLIASLVKNNLYVGCLVFGFADIGQGRLSGDAEGPKLLRRIPARPGYAGGSCAWDREIKDAGVLMGEVKLTPAGNAFAEPIQFTVVDTGVRL